MKQKLIKLSETHYIIVDDSEIKKGDLCYDKEADPSHINIKHIVKCLRTASDSYWNKYCKKITHSTQRLEGTGFLSLSEVEQLVNGYSVEKMAENYVVNDFDEYAYYGFIDGFYAHQELVKNKNKELYTFIKDCATNWDCDSDSHRCNTICRTCEAEKIIESLLPKIEWEITFDEQSKIKLI